MAVAVSTCSSNIPTPCVLATTWCIVFAGSIHDLILTLNKLKCPSGFAAKNYFMIELFDNEKIAIHHLHFFPVVCDIFIAEGRPRFLPPQWISS